MSEAATEREGAENGGGSKDPRVEAAKRIAGGDRDLENVVHAAQGAELDEREERSALEYLLGAPQPVRRSITVQYETPEGLTPLTFVVRAMDSRKIDKIETANIDRNNGTIDRITADCQIVAEATIELRDATGETTRLTDEKFLTVMRANPETGQPEPVSQPNPALAIEQRFRDQMGLISGVVLEIKRAGGYAGDRVSQAKRMMLDASLG